MELTEYSSYEELQAAIKTADEYGYYSARAVKKRLRTGEVVFHRTHTPAPEKIPVMYLFAIVKNCIGWFSYTIVKGAEGQSFACRSKDDRSITMVHSHAINRFIERHGWKGSLEECQQHILRNLITTYTTSDDVTKEFTTYFDGGLFLGVVDGGVWRFKTIIMNRQCGELQRMQSLN